MDVDEVELLLRQALAGKEKDINAFIKQFEDDYNVSDEELDEVLSHDGKYTPNDIMTLLRMAGRDFEYIHDPEPDPEKYMQYIKDAMNCRHIQKMMKELQK